MTAGGQVPRLELALLGPQWITLDGKPVEGFAFQKARALLYYLVMEGGQPLSRESLVGMLWPEMPEAAARTNLRQALSNLREAIGDEQAEPPLLSVRRDSLQLNPHSQLWTDVAGFVKLLDTCEAHAHRHPSRCGSCARKREEAIRLYRGDFLAGFHLKDADPYEEWAAIRRERLHRRMAGALARQASFYEAIGKLEPALEMLARQLVLDPWIEEANRDRMRLLAQLGRRSEALAQFELCRRLLSDELGVEPAAETVGLYQQIRQGLPLELEPRPTGQARPLPLPAAPFVGRERELAELTDWLEDPGHRLVTLMGGSGVGKSRLALEAAERVRSSFSSGVAFVRGSVLDGPEQLPAAILAALGVDPPSPADPSKQVLEALQQRDLLLVLDSLEHLLPQARSLIQLILDYTRSTAILATSQERIGLQAERCFVVEGLAIEAAAGAPGQPGEAIQLFLERGRRVNRRLGEQEEDLSAAQRICSLVEGVPLAIELAASATDTRSCQQIAADLEADIRSLASRHFDLPVRHRSLDAALDYSWNLLDPSQQRVLRRVSVFRGGWDAQAAARVAGASLADLQGLSDHSLIRLDHAGRFSLHALMHQHALATLLDSDDAAEVRHNHFEYFQALAETAEPELLGPMQTEWLPRLDQELANFRQALTWGMEQGDANVVSRLCLALARYWMIRGHLAEGQQLIEAVLRLPQPPDPALQVRLHNRAGILAAMQRHFEQAEPHLQASVQLSRELGDTQGEAMSLNSLGAMSIERGDYGAARLHLEACLPAWRQLGNPNGLASTLNNLGAVAMLAGEREIAHKRFEESLPLFRELGDRRMIAGVLYNLGDLSLAEGNLTHTRLRLGESLALRQEIGEVGGVAESLEGFARIAVHEQQPELAAQLFGAASAMRQSVGAPLAPVNQPDYDRAVEAARRQLGDQAYQSAWRSGSELTPAQAVNLAQSV